MAIIYVNKNAVGDNNGISWLNAFTNLQDALENAESEDQVWVAEGTYRPTNNTDRTISFDLKNGVELYGGFEGRETSLEQRDWSNNVTILSGDIGTTNNISDNSYHVVTANGITQTSILDGFSILNGNADFTNAFGGGIDRRGGGVYIDDSNIKFTNLIVSANQARVGGGLYALNSSYEVVNVIFDENIAIDLAGAIYNNNSESTFNNVDFIQNQSVNNGGAIFNAESSLELFNVRFENNLAQEDGGAIFNVADSNPVINNSIFIRNRAFKDGGAIFNTTRSSPTITNSIFEGNIADRNGGAIALRDSTTLANITNSIFNGNSGELGGAIYIRNNDSLITSSTFVNNEAERGAAIFSLEDEVDTQPIVTNSIFFNNEGTEDTPPIINENGANTVVSYSIVEGGYQGIEIIDDFPTFLDEQDNDFRLRSNSPGIDAGNNDVDRLSEDLAGNDRVFNEIIDIGAYELIAPLLTIEDISVSQKQDSAEFVVKLVDSNNESFASDDTITVDFATEDNSATAGENYTSTSGTVTFEPGETEKTITVDLNEDADIDGDKTFNLNLSNASNAGIVDSQGVGTLLDSSLDTPIYRFQNLGVPGTYLYAGEEERQEILASFPNFIEEGLAFKVGVQAEDDLIPLYRFQSKLVPGTYLFAGEEERQNINRDFSQSFTEEGLAFYVYEAGSGSGTDFSRFQNTAQPGTYLFATGDERENIRVNFPIFEEEGAAFEVEL